MNEALHRVTWTILASGAVVSGIAFALGGVATGVGALVGTGVATLNWLAIQQLVRSALGSGTGRSAVTILLFVKMAALFGLCYWLLAVLRVDVLGFTFGMSALVLGVLFGAAGLAKASDEDSLSDEGGSAPEGGAGRPHEEG